MVELYPYSRERRFSKCRIIRTSVVECVCHDQDGVEEGFFYMYMCHFSQLHMQIPFDDFTMGVLRLLNAAHTQLHPNS